MSRELRREEPAPLASRKLNEDDLDGLARRAGDGVGRDYRRPAAADE